jgi:uncharacterized Zn-binding protein involved in type VI secretion
MKGISRLGDINTTGGKILKFSPNVNASNKPVGLLTSLVTSHFPAPKDPRHIAAKVITGSPSVFCNGLPVLRVGSFCTCGHRIIQGSLSVFVP